MHADLYQCRLLPKLLYTHVFLKSLSQEPTVPYATFTMDNCIDRLSTSSNKSSGVVEFDAEGMAKVASALL